MGRLVLVGVDGSPESREAALLGRRITSGAGGVLRLVTAASHPMVEAAATRGGMSPDRLQEALLDAAADRASASLRGDFSSAELDALVVRPGSPEQVLAEASTDFGADTIVLGGRRHRAPSSWIQRRIAHRLLHLSRTPVVVTGPSGEHVERVLAAVDRSFAARPTIEVAHRLSTLLDVPMSALHVVSRPPLPSGLELDLDPDDLSRREDESARAEIERQLGDGVELTVVHGDIVRCLRQAVRADPTTALVVGAQGRGRISRFVLGSVAEVLLTQLPCTLVVVPSWPGASERAQDE